ncbi:DUF2199 domain-containing protein [Thiohalophilus sp.]|uniref:DUF2199 domain-containing protein n=1 Tax=Thiohalophilus sp. TaxID=3028392 RepID=UPI003A103139
MTYTCASCGEVHDDLPDLSFDRPSYAAAVPEKKGRRDVCHEHRLTSVELYRRWESGLPESACRGRLQTARCCCVQKAWW